ncbi:MAG: thioredoxin family protein [Chloroflexota bacterium]|nr:thioredoxin family protein [Chloroflexota bacterium]
MEIKVLGGGCARCERLEELAREAVGELDIEATFIKVKKMDEIMAYDVVSTPALVIDEEIKSSGRIPRKEEIAEWIRAARGGIGVNGP